MKFEKIFLVSLGLFVLLFSTASLKAAENLQSLDAIWESAVLNNLQKPKQAPKRLTKSEKKLAVAAAQKFKNTNPNKSKKQIVPKADQLAADKLAQQRKIWKAKWDAEQKAKKQTELAKKPRLQKPVWQKPNKQIVAQQTPKPLTREQYHLRWQQQQLKKQQSVQAKAKSPVFTNADIQAIRKVSISKPSVTQQQAAKQSQFRASHRNAAYNALPFQVEHKLRAAKLNKHAMSAYVQDVNSNKPLLGFQDKTSRVPASVMKLITSYAALGTLGPNYRWPLDVFTKGVVRNGTLQGDLIVKGYGSPEFNQNDLRKVLQGIKHKGIRNVSGRVVFDNSYFNVANQGSFDGKSQSAYNAQPDALLYNERLSQFQVRAKGKRVHVSTTTPTHNLKIVNKMRKTRRGCRPRIGVSKRGVQTVVTFSGRYSSRCGTRTYSRVISRPAEMIYGAMQAMWKRDVGGRLNTQFAMGRVPASARPLLRTHSRTLAEILPTIDKDSNNVMARQVLLTIGAKRSGRQGTQQNGANAIGTWLVSRGLNFPELRIENGSGLSRRARISARHVGDLLVDAYRSPYRNILMQSLAIAGVDGTMKRRLKGSHVRGRGFFKTGTLRDVRSIAGYVKAVDGKTYVMAILHNDPRAPRRGLAAHDKLIEWVFSGGRQQQIAMR